MPTQPVNASRVSPLLSAAQWTALANGDDGAAFEWVNGDGQLFVTASGTFGAGGSITIQGSANGTAWSALVLVGGGAATFTAAGGGAVLGLPRFIRPLVTAGSGATALVVDASIQRGVSA